MCDSTVTVNITVLPQLSSTINNTLCFGESIIVNGTTYNASNLTGTEIFNNIGTNMCDSTVTVNISVNSAIDTSVDHNSPSLTANASGASYQWLDCDNNYTAIVGETNQSFTASSNGSYAVEITENNCSDTSTCIQVTGTGIEENSFDNQVSVYPNPNDGVFTVSIFGTLNNCSIIITDLVGKFVYQQTITTPQSEISLESLQTGVYVIRIKNGNQITTKRLVKQ
jgi:hypothetical protein